MGRPPLPLGTYGRCSTATPSGEVQARVKFRDYDGRVRLVSKTGAVAGGRRACAEAALTARRAPGGTAALTSGTRMTALADAWLAADHGWSTGTERTYRSVVRKQVQPAFGRLCVREVTPGVVGRALPRSPRTAGPALPRPRGPACRACSPWRSRTAR